MLESISASPVALWSVWKWVRAREDVNVSIENIPSQRVTLANGGVLVEEFTTLPALRRKRHLRYRVNLGDQ